MGAHIMLTGTGTLKANVNGAGPTKSQTNFAVNNRPKTSHYQHYQDQEVADIYRDLMVKSASR